MTAAFEDVRITTSDGVQLSARLWLPAGSDRSPAPAVLECHPYRKADAAIFDAVHHRFAAERGYASVQLDLRGSGDSGGALEDEYLAREHADVVEVIAWIRRQPWCTGAVGMLGVSWGGFDALQVAALDPPGLEAVIAVCASDDRFADDVHYAGGCVLAGDMVSWSTTMLAYNARPPDPATYGEGWLDTWRARLERNRPWVGTWLRHQHPDPYWRHGSVGHDLDAIRCPMLLVGGWADGYRDSIERMVRRRRTSACTRVIVGPWSHAYPHLAAPGPQIDFLDEMTRWWDQWLRGIDRGVASDPPLRLYLQDAIRPGEPPAWLPGRWIALEAFPAPAANLALRRDRTHHSDSLAPAVVPPTKVWTGPDPRLHLDQRPQDERSQSFTSPRLDAPLELVGVPEVELALAPGAVGMLAVRLCDVWPDGASTLLARGVGNLDRHDGGPLRITLSATSVALPAGHRLRIAVSPSSWPYVWPAPDSSASVRSVALRLPALDAARVLDHPEPATGGTLTWPEVTWLAPLRERTWSARTGDDGQHVIEIARGYPAPFQVDETGVVYRDEGNDTFRIAETDPTTAVASSVRSIELSGPGWSVTLTARSTMTCDRSRFYVDSELQATLDGDEVFEREWSDAIPRDAC